MVVVVKENANGKIEFTKEELEELLEKARQEGIEASKNTQYIYTQPTPPTPYTPNPYISPVTCGTPKTISCDERIGISTKH